MRRHLTTAALVFAWLCANGGMWDVMQVAAWARMFAGYSETMTVSQALQATLDPAKPCDMCIGIAQAKGESEKNLPSPAQQAATKFVLISHAVEPPVFFNDPGDWTAGVAMAALERQYPVRLRPPRV